MMITILYVCHYNLSVCLSVYVHLFVYFSSVRLSHFQCVGMSLCLSVSYVNCLFVFLSICLSFIIKLPDIKI